MGGKVVGCCSGMVGSSEFGSTGDGAILLTLVRSGGSAKVPEVGGGLSDVVVVAWAWRV